MSIDPHTYDSLIDPRIEACLEMFIFMLFTLMWYQEYLI